jgi:hypothetical protein
MGFQARVAMMNGAKFPHVPAPESKGVLECSSPMMATIRVVGRWVDYVVNLHDGNATEQAEAIPIVKRGLV